MLVRRDYIDRNMVWDTFSYYAKGWWSACKDYITVERADKGDDSTLFRDFGALDLCRGDNRERQDASGT